MLTVEIKISSCPEPQPLQFTTPTNPQNLPSSDIKKVETVGSLIVRVRHHALA